MTWFLAIAAGMVAIALAWVLPALLRSRAAGGVVQTRASNLAILRDQLAELDADVAAGTLSQQQYRQAREDLERRALEETRDAVAPAASAPARAGVTAIVLAVSIPLCAAALYWQFGTPEALSPQSDLHGGGQPTAQEVDAMVAKLAARLEQAPDDGNGWALLARSYLVMQRYADAIAAYERAAAILKDNADLLADYADALAMAQGRRLDGKPLQIIERALQIDPM
ncbi:MAG: c-type cytochrome biogenesis protein CcmI, partial [Betaproteobacteria bacterium]|nr:c-type cytochrome biogenesis protein CcmI [Betaproteobacteria bacterium]